MKKPLITETIDEMHERFTIEALRLSKGNRLNTSKLLGVTERTVYAKIAKYNIQPAQWKNIKANKKESS